MEKRVIILIPNGRRQIVNVTPNTTLLQILEEACLKHGFDSEEYVLKHHNKEVGLTQMFRFSGLPNNCMLEMCPAERKRVESNVDICLQLEDGSRQQAQFVPTDSLWRVIEILSADAATTYTSPVAIYMRQEIIGRSDLAKTTLKSLGIIAGRAMIRFLDKKPEELKSQANVYIPPTVKETLKETDGVIRPTKISQTNQESGGFVVTRDLMQSLKKSTTDDANSSEITGETEQISIDTETSTSEPTKPIYDWSTGSGRTMYDSAEFATKQAVETATEMDVEPEVYVIGERNAILYSLDATQKHIEDLPDSFFDLTVSDLKLVLRDLKKIAAGNEDMPLLTEKLRELEENKTMLNKIAQYKNCVIRIKFPNRYVLQGVFKPIDSIANVMDFVRKFIKEPEAEFFLFAIPPKTVLPLDKTLLELNFVPTAVIHFGLTVNDQQEREGRTIMDVEQNFIKSEFLPKLTSAEGAFYAANKLRISNRKHENLESDRCILNTSSKSPGPSTGAIPKRPRNDFK